ncbi:MAG: hypothetical protein J0I32_23250 [Sphingobacteriales bacterium]|nr:hypothetical protein [Sphingobacteriales bacterium]OJW01958.1 MAG: hypothetical protein BGO52_00300 [Sphingobacteriales bacterium 44-61]
MIATPSELAALESFFASVELPRSFALNPAVTITDLPKFVSSNMERIKSGVMADAVARPRYDDLLLIKSLLEEAGSKQ